MKSEILTQYRRVKNARIVAIVTTLLCAVYSALTVFDIGRYTVESVNSDIAGAVVPTLLCVAITLIAWSAHVCIRASAAREEMAAMRAAIKENGALYIRNVTEAKSTVKRDKLIRNILRGVIIAASVALIALGIMNGGMADVLAKAIKICTECIGLG